MKNALTLAVLVAALTCGCGNRNRSTGSTAAGVNANAPTRFEITIENVSTGATLTSPISPGAYAVHDSRASLFTAGWPERGEGLEPLAEDGDPTDLATSLSLAAGVRESGAFTSTPPGDVTRFTVEATPNAPYLSLAAMLVQSNDLLLASDPEGLPLFDATGTPLAERTVTLDLWDAGTEQNEVPGAGPNQPPRQSAPNTGSAEGVVQRSRHGSRSLPSAANLAALTIDENGGTFTITIENVGASDGAFVTPLAPVFWATHDDTYTVFRDGQPVLGNGLETLAEDGSPMGLVASATGAPGVGAAGAQAVTLERPSAGAGPAAPGERFRFSVTPDAAHPRLSLACMLVESNDAFVAFGPGGIELLDSAGAVRALADVRADAALALAVWDAGTERNETPGAGPNQPMRQAGPNTGPVDSDPSVRRYGESGSDVGPAQLAVRVVQGAGGCFDVTITNTSAATGAQGVFTPVAWAVHGSDVLAFAPGQPASAGLEQLAEDGDPSAYVAELGAAGALASGVLDTPQGAAAPGPLAPGASYTACVVPDAAHPYLSVASMLVPSNDTFFAFGPSGLRLLNPDGSARSDAELATDVASALDAWDAGTEANEIGAAGPNQAPRQAAAGAGLAGGDGTVRRFNDPVHRYPPSERLLRVTVRPLP